MNRALRHVFGVEPTDAKGRQLFRLAMTTQLEKRIGAVANFTDNGIYLNTVKGVHTLPKYNFGGHFDKPKWVLERLRFDELPEVPETKTGSYEPIHVFPHVDGRNSMPPVEAVVLFVNLLLYGAKKTFDDYVKEDDETFKKEVAQTEDILNDNHSFMQGQMQDGEAVTVGKSYQGESPLLKEK